MYTSVLFWYQSKPDFLAFNLTILLQLINTTKWKSLSARRSIIFAIRKTVDKTVLNIVKGTTVVLLELARPSCGKPRTNFFYCICFYLHMRYVNKYCSFCGVRLEPILRRTPGEPRRLISLTWGTI